MKQLVLATTVVLSVVAAFIFYFYHETLPPSIPLKVEGQPTVGYRKALVHVVLFEEPKCLECKNFTLNVYPKLKTEFIDTNKIRYTVIPVSFLPDSMPAAIALLAAMHQDERYQNEEIFFTFLDYMYRHQPEESENWARIETLEEYAKQTSPAIDLAYLRESVAKERYRLQIEQNTDYGMEIMHGELTTPTAYVNGIKAEDLNHRGISALIRTVLRQKGGE